ncbi:MAG: NUDIX hydrolase [Lachnospiraceae bacterium]|nr:NUDIX hydrolase [Lachnospiraceae bacterium]
MKFLGLKKLHQGKFITRYDLSYETVDGIKKDYEIISRDPDMKGFFDVSEHKVDAVVIIMHSEDGEKVLLNREYRMAVGGFVYNFPAGLIDPGEDALIAAKRELKEETGLDILKVEDVIYESYSAVGFSNEKNMCVVGVAGGTFSPSTSTLEEIEAGWFTKAEIRKLLKDQHFAARSQAYCYLWSKKNSDN